MTLNPLSDQKIIDSRSKNGTPWTTAIREGQIESRKLVTNQAVIDAVLGRSPKTVFDIGCGEGWLARELIAKDVDVYGVDVVPALVDQARVASGGRFDVLSYEDIACGKVTAKFDVCVCNFALLGNESVTNLLGTMPSLLNPGGSLIVQTIHPVIGCGDQPYQDGWRKDPGSDSVAASKIRRRGIFASWIH